MNHILKVFCVVASAIVTLFASAEVLTDQDFRTVIRTAGVWPTITGNNKSGSQNNAFDGVMTLTAPTYIEKGGKTYACAGHRIDEYQSDRWRRLSRLGLAHFNRLPSKRNSGISTVGCGRL